MLTLPQSRLVVPLPPEAHSHLPRFIHQDPSPHATGWCPRRPASPAVCTASVGPRAMPSPCAAPCRPTRPCVPVPARSSPGGAAPSAVSDLAESPEPRPLSFSLSSAPPLSPSQPGPQPRSLPSARQPSTRRNRGARREDGAVGDVTPRPRRRRVREAGGTTLPRGPRGAPTSGGRCGARKRRGGESSGDRSAAAAAAAAASMRGSRLPAARGAFVPRRWRRRAAALA